MISGKPVLLIALCGLCGVLVVSELEPGLLFDLLLMTPERLEQTVGPFKASGGQDTLGATVPGLHDVTLQISGGGEAAEGRLRVQVNRKNVGDLGGSLGISRTSTSRAAVQMYLPAGGCSVEVFRDDGQPSSRFRPLHSQTIEVPPRAAIFTLDLD